MTQYTTDRAYAWRDDDTLLHYSMGRLIVMLRKSVSSRHHKYSSPLTTNTIQPLPQKYCMTLTCTMSYPGRGEPSGRSSPPAASCRDSTWPARVNTNCEPLTTRNKWLLVSAT